jgi:predicted Zn-dependent protease with MMP-like domain
LSGDWESWFVRLSFGQFCKVVERAVAELPEEFRSKLVNVTFNVLDEPCDDDWANLDERGQSDDESDELLGLFVGVFRTEQSAGHATPCEIRIFRRPLERVSRSRAELLLNIQDTVVHELGHYFGMDEEDLEPFERIAQERREKLLKAEESDEI